MSSKFVKINLVPTVRLNHGIALLFFRAGHGQRAGRDTDESPAGNPGNPPGESLLMEDRSSKIPVDRDFFPILTCS
jgi:hypothetical protein